MTLSNLFISAWINQKKQMLEWLRGDPILGAWEAIQTMFAVRSSYAVNKNFSQHLKYNSIALLVSLSMFVVLFSIMNISCRIMSLFALKLDPPNIFNAFVWSFWIQVGLWGILLKYFFYRSTEECFYGRMKYIDNEGLAMIQSWPENYSILLVTWKSMVRTIRSYRWLIAHQLIQTLPYSQVVTVLMSTYVLLTSARRQPLPIVLSLLFLPVTNFAKMILQFSITVRCALREIPILYRLKDKDQRNVIKVIWSSAYSFGYGSVLVMCVAFPIPCLLWFHVAAAYADLVANKTLGILEIVNESKITQSKNAIKHKK